METLALLMASVCLYLGDLQEHPDCPAEQETVQWSCTPTMSWEWEPSSHPDALTAEWIEVRRQDLTGSFIVARPGYPGSAQMHCHHSALRDDLPMVPDGELATYRARACAWHQGEALCSSWSQRQVQWVGVPMACWIPGQLVPYQLSPTEPAVMVQSYQEIPCWDGDDLLAPGPAPACTLGSMDPDSASAEGKPGRCMAVKVSAGCTAVLQQIRVRRAGPGQVTMAVYSDLAGEPHTRLSHTAVTSSDQAALQPPLALTVNQVVWLTRCDQTDSITYFYDTAPGVMRRAQVDDFSSPPETWPTADQETRDYLMAAELVE